MLLLALRLHVRNRFSNKARSRFFITIPSNDTNLTSLKNQFHQQLSPIMSFHATTESHRLRDGHILECRCRNGHGDWVDSSLDLDQHIGNSDGYFIWDGKDWSRSARLVNLEGGHYLTAELPMRDGGHRERMGIELNDRIANEDGRLVYTKG